MDPPKAFTWQHQPLKAIYLTYVVLSTIAFRLPCWILKGTIPSLRPRPTWTMGRTLLIRVLQTVIPTVFNSATFHFMRVDPRKFAKQEEAAGLVWIDAAPDLVVGEVNEYAKLNDVKVDQVPAYWFGDRDTVTNRAGQRASPGEKVILAFHPGGWVIGDASPGGLSAGISNEFLTRFPQFSRLLGVEYRLSQGTPLPRQNPFPAALLDAICAYNYLINELRFEPRNVLFLGESAGGTLAAQLMRYIAGANLPKLPPPGALLLLSPTMDWGTSHMGPGSSMVRNSDSDWVHPFTTGYCASALLGKLPLSDADENAWISLASHNLPTKTGVFAGFAPTLIIGGGGEMTLDAMKTAAERMVVDIGADKARFVEIPDASHNMLTLGWHPKELEDTYRVIGRWIQEYF